MNIYELLGLDIFSSEKEVDKKYEFYKEFIRRHQSNDIDATKKLIESEYETLKKVGKAKYDSSIRDSKKVVDINDYKNHYEDAGDKPRRYKTVHDNEKKQAKNVSFKIKAIKIIAGVTVFVCGATLLGKALDSTPKNKTSDVTITQAIQSVYTFKYKVESGESIESIKSRFDADSIKRGPGKSGYLELGEIVTVVTRDKALADEMNAEYESELKAEEPTSFDSYTIQPGDTLPEIAEKYGVTCQQIMDYNENIEDIRTIYAGDTIRIPVYNQVKTK